MEEIKTYFEGEKLQCSIGVFIALTCLGLAIYFFFSQKIMLKGIAYPFALFSVLLIIICAGVVFRSPKDIIRVQGYYQNEPKKLTQIEIPRMEKVMKNFALIKKAEIVIFFIGFMLFLFIGKHDLVKGIAIGLMILGLIWFTFDHLAEKRGNIYIEFLKKLEK